MELINYKIIHLPETDSTNLYALRLLSNEKPPEGCIIRSDFQTNGRGLDTNSWESEAEMNLTFSIILYPDFGAEHQFLLNKTVSLGIWDYLVDELPKQKVSIKWPNDIYIGDKKACGILIQNSIIGYRLDYVVVGIGLNVNQTLFRSKAPNPVSMKMITEKNYDLDVVLNKLISCIYKRYQQLNQGLPSAIEQSYGAAMYRLNEWHYYIFKDKKIYARIKGTNSYGQLLLELEDGNVKISDLKEVQFCI